MTRRFELLPGEKIIKDEPIHWKNYLASLLAMSLCFFLMLLRAHLRDVSLINLAVGKALVPAGTNAVIFWVEMLALLAFSMAALVRAIDISYIHYYLTDRRIIAISGVVERRFSEMLLAKCEMVYLTQSAYERMYNCGDILCVSAGASLFLDDVRNAVVFKQDLMSILSSVREKGSSGPAIHEGT